MENPSSSGTTPVQFVFAIGLILSCAAVRSLAADPPAPWVADKGDGTYRNPIIWADYSDPDAIRVGKDYYLTASSFSNAPGLPILHSTDLINWTILSHALPEIAPTDRFATGQPGLGVYAPSIRYRDKKFYVYYPDPDSGLYLVTATDPAGPWSKPVLVKGIVGLIDPCPFWDEDGKAYLICGWAGSRGKRANLLTLYEMNPDSTQLLDEGKVLIDGRTFNWKVLEGPKMYKREGWYYVFAPAGGVGNGFQGVFRSKTIQGPYESRITLDQGSTKINGPHQGAWLETPTGENWFLHFQYRQAYGRVTLLQPMQWKDGWPIMGINQDAAGKGEPVTTFKKPTGEGSIAVPQMSDEFDSGKLALAWQWQANPKLEWSSLLAHPGSLRLPCLEAPTNLYRASNVLGQKFPAPEFSATTELEFTPRAAGDQTGLVVMGTNYAWLGIRQLSENPTKLRLSLMVREKADTQNNGTETEIAGKDLDAPGNGKPLHLFLRVNVRNTDKDREALSGTKVVCEFTFSRDGKTFESLKPDYAFNAQGGKWVGARVGPFATNTNPSSSAKPGAVMGHADYAWFRVTPLQP